MSVYTSMPLSFLVLFEIHSVDWFGLVFVLPLLKNIRRNKFNIGDALSNWACLGPSGGIVSQSPIVKASF